MKTATKNLVTSSGYYCAVRFTPCEGGKEWLDRSTIGADYVDSEQQAKKAEKELPQFYKTHPLKRIVKITIVEQA